VVLRDALEENGQVTALDVRVNKIPPEVCAGIRELLLRNEDAQRAAQGGRDRRARTVPATTAPARSAVADEK